jgi:hypothetical protein
MENSVMPRVGEKFTFDQSWQEQIGLRSVTDPQRQELADRQQPPAAEGPTLREQIEPYWTFTTATAYHDEVFPAHDFVAGEPRFEGGPKEHPHCSRCHVPEGVSEAKWDDGRCAHRTFLHVPANVVEKAAIAAGLVLASPVLAPSPDPRAAPLRELLERWRHLAAQLTHGHTTADEQGHADGLREAANDLAALLASPEEKK